VLVPVQERGELAVVAAAGTVRNQRVRHQDGPEALVRSGARVFPVRKPASGILQR
jgi:hypothetical protein